MSFFLPSIILGGQAPSAWPKATTHARDRVQRRPRRIRRSCSRRPGATWLHVVDLDGAQFGQSRRTSAVVERDRGADEPEGGGGRRRALAGQRRDRLAGRGRVPRRPGHRTCGAILISPRLPSRSSAPMLLVAGIDAKGRRGRCGRAGREGSGVAAARPGPPHGGAGIPSTSSTPTSPATACRPAWRPAAYAQHGRRPSGNPVIASGGVAAAADIRALGAVADSRRGRHRGSGHLRGHSYRGRWRARRATAPSSCPISWKRRSVPDHRRAGKLAKQGRAARATPGAFDRASSADGIEGQKGKGGSWP